MRIVAVSNDPVRLSFLSAVLKDAGIEVLVLDAYASVTDGSIGAIPRRLAVSSEDEPVARRILVELDDAGTGGV